MRTSKCGLWWPAVPKNRRPDQPDWFEGEIWEERWLEIVIIDTDPVDEAALHRRLGACLVGDAGAFTPAAQRHLPAAFPVRIAGAL